MTTTTARVRKYATKAEAAAWVEPAAKAGDRSGSIIASYASGSTIESLTEWATGNGRYTRVKATAEVHAALASVGPRKGLRRACLALVRRWDLSA